MPFREFPFTNASPSHNSLVEKVFDLARCEEVELYLVGGYIRDCLLAELRSSSLSPGKDLDFAVAGSSAMEFAKTVCQRLGAHYVELDKENDTARAVLINDTGTELDFAGCLGGSIEVDLKRRDFTVNAMAWTPERAGAVLDECGSIEDIENLLIRAVSEKAFQDDPLRLLRAFRFSALLHAEIEESTLQWVRHHCNRIEKVAFERINHEIFALLECENSFRVLEQMGECGLLEAIYEELVPTRKVTANAFHHLGLFEHSLEAVRQLELELGSLPDWINERLQEEISGGISRLAVTKLAALLHDIGKPETWEITEEGRHTFYGHDKLGADMAEHMARKHKWPNSIEKSIVKLIGWHLRPGQLFHQGEATDRALHRFYRRVGDYFPELMALAFGDLGATRGDGLVEDARLRLKEKFFSLMSGYLKFKEDSSKNKSLLNGQDVMDLRGIKPGPLVGEIIEALLEAQAMNEVEDRASAESFVLSYQAKELSG